MTRVNDRYIHKMGLPAAENTDALDNLIEETERAVVNTRDFLEKIHRSDADNKRYVEQVRDSLEGTLRNLKRKRDMALEELARSPEPEPEG